jgi:adenylate kinase
VRILFLGAQGSGKGTQAKRIESEYGLPHIATGDILRAAMANGTELGRRVKPIVDAGELVPDALMVDLIRERLGEDDAESGFVLDGFPRTLAQAEALDEMLAEIGKPVSVVLELRVPRDVAIERLLRRAELEGRADDTPETIERRLALYDEVTRPVVDHYAPTGALVAIHGNQPVDGVWADIQEVLERADAGRTIA